MSELDDLEEFNLAPDRNGSAIRARNSKKVFGRILADSHTRPRWRRQLAGKKSWAPGGKRTSK